MPHKEEKKGGSEKFKSAPGNQPPNTPNRKESERGHQERGQSQERGKRGERRSER